MTVQTMLIAGFFLLTSLISAQTLRPYILGAVSDNSISETADLVKVALQENAFDILGEYMPADDPDRWLIIFSCKELLDAAAKGDELAGFAAALRIGLTREDGRVNVSLTSPEYWLNAYYRDDYKSQESTLSPMYARLKSALQSVGQWSGKDFGSVKGLDTDKLRTYRYMVRMQKFHNTEVLGEFDSYQEAVDKVESSLIKGVPNVKKVFSVEVPGKDMKLYGFALSGEEGESHFLPIIDNSEPKHTAFLPYEFLISGEEVHMLHGRFRIALSFPDLTMRTFTKIMSTPGNIEDMLESVVE